MRTILTIIFAFAAASSALAINASFEDTTAIIRDGSHTVRLPDLVDEHAFYSTIHSVQRRGNHYYLVFGSSEFSRGWPPRSGYCGCGIESFIKWIDIKDGKIIKEQEGRFESCFKNRDGWNISWKDGKLLWYSQGIDAQDDSYNPKLLWMDYTWLFDPSHPEIGITETKKEAQQGAAANPKTRTGRFCSDRPAFPSPLTLRLVTRSG